MAYEEIFLCVKKEESPNELLKKLEMQLALSKSKSESLSQDSTLDYGRILSIKDSVIMIEGLKDVESNEMIEFRLDDGAVLSGVALNLEYDLVKALAFGNEKLLKVGFMVRRTGRVVGTICGETVLGRVINPLGQVLDGGLDLDSSLVRDIEIKAPGVIQRKRVDQSLETGIKMIDSLVPIGRGQRELIIGDKKTGKTTIAVDTILHQKTVKDPVICVYVSIGKRMSEIARIVKLLKDKDAMSYTVVIASRASDPASLQYIAPYSGCTIAEYFRDNGMSSLIVYDDLTRHADIYRQIALLLRRPVGREAYPGDVFYLHSRLLERASRLSSDLGAGSLTALPIVETLQGDVSAYIPTNIISITDGQIYLDAAKHQEGFRPAVDPGISVSRIGSAAQSKVMKSLAGSLKLKLAQFREVEEFAKFGSDLDAVTLKTLEEGRKFTQILKQAKNNPIDVYKQVVLLYAGFNGYLDGKNSDEIRDYEVRLFEFLENSVFFRPYRYILVEDTKVLSVLSFILGLFNSSNKA